MSPHKPRRQELSPNMEDYLETIYLQDLQGLPAKVKNIAEAMGVSKPSVTEALSVLQDRGLVLHQKYGDIELTDRGRLTASDIYYRHELLSDFLKNVLNVPDNSADDDACKIEHLLSETTIEHIAALMRYVNGDSSNNSFLKDFHGKLEELIVEVKDES